MKLKSQATMARLLTTATWSALAIVIATPAHAQQTPVAEGPERSDGTTGEDIIVRGIQASLKRAQDIKRDAPSVIEAITAEDLGQFTDNNLADALQRVPGVQVDRDDFGGQGDRISIRGLGGAFVMTTIEGRAPLGAGSTGSTGTRIFNYSILPPDLIAGLEVTKTPTASSVDQGLAGGVNVKLVHPLDVRYPKGRNVILTGEARGTYFESSDKGEPRYSALLAARNASHTLGFYLAGVYGKVANDNYNFNNNSPYVIETAVKLDQNGDRKFTNGVDTQTRIAGFSSASFYETTRLQTTKAAAGGLQWQPGSHWDIFIDGLYSNFDDHQDQQFANDGGIFRIYNNNTNPFLLDPTKLIFADGLTLPDASVVGAQLPYLIGVKPGAGISFAGPNFTTVGSNFYDRLLDASVWDNDTKTYMGGLKIKYQSGRLKAVADISDAKTHYTQIYDVVEVASRTVNAWSDPAVGLGYDLSSGYPVFTNFDKLNLNTPPSAGSNPNTLFWVPYYGPNRTTPTFNGTNLSTTGNTARIQESQFDANSFAGRLDFDYRLDGFLTDLEFGGRYSISKIDSITSIQKQYNNDTSIIGVNSYFQDPANRAAFINAALPGTLNPIFAPGTPMQMQMLHVDLNAAAALVPGFLTDSLANGGLIANPANSWHFKENTGAFYGQLDFKNQRLLPFVGNIGLRVVNTNYRADAGRLIARLTPIPAGQPGSAQNPIPISSSQNYWDFLPNFNANFYLTRQLHLRLGYARTLTRPDPRDVSPIQSLSDPTSATQNLIISAISAQIAAGKSYSDAIRDPSVLQLIPSAYFGNTDLKPYHSNLFDATLEWYTPNGGSIVVSYFYKRIKDYILAVPSGNVALVAGATFDVAVPTNFDSNLIPYRITQPTNFSDAKVHGFEVGFNQPFTFLPGPLKYTGLQANYTFVSSAFDRQDNANLGQGFPGSSRHNFNVNGYFSLKAFEARLAYSYRNAYYTGVTSLSGSASTFLATYTKPVSQLDANLALRPTKNFEVRFVATNILGTDRVNYVSDPRIIQNIISRTRTFGVGLRYRL